MVSNGAPRRFARCPELELVTPAGRSLVATVATDPAARLLGLTRLEAERLRPLLLPACGAVHGFWMRAELDVCFLAMPAGEAARATVLAVSALRRRRAISLPRALRRGAARGRIAALELPEGMAAELGLADGAALTIGHTRAART